MSRPSLPAFAVTPVACVAAAAAVVLTALAGRYGFHRDELYFLRAAEHPAWGYVDQPPLTPMIAKVSTALFGDTPMGLRVASTVAAVATIVLIAAIARECGAGRRGQLIAACSAAVSGMLLVVSHMVSTATFDLSAWVALGWLVLRTLRTRDGRWWLVIGPVAGLALLNKYLVVLLFIAVLVGLSAVGPRSVLRSRWLPVGVLLALIVAGPNLWWQAAHGWPQLTVASGISADDGAENRVMFVPLQLLQLSPFLVPVWVAGLVRLWRDPSVQWAKAIAVAYPVLCVLVLLLGGKPYYALPLLMVVMAAGAESVAAWSTRGGRGRPWLLGTAFAAAAVTSAVVALPLLPPSALAVPNAINREQGEQVGWPALVEATAEGWAQIPAERRDRAVIFTQNYGQAGAIDRYGDAYDLPKAYSGHMSYADWGPPPPEADGAVLLVHQEGDTGFERWFTGCRQVARVDNGFGVDNEEQNAAIVLCSGTAEPWAELWSRLRHFY